MAHPSHLKEMKDVRKSLRKAREELDQLMAEVEAHSQSQDRGQGGAEEGGNERQEDLQEVKTEGVEVPLYAVEEADIFEEVKPRPKTKTKKTTTKTPDAQEKPHKRKRGEDEQTSPPEQAVDPDPVPEEPRPKHAKKTSSKNAEKDSASDIKERKQHHKASRSDIASGSSGRDRSKAVDIFKNIDLGGAMSPDALRAHCHIIAEEYEKLFQQVHQMHLEMAHMRAELREKQHRSA